MDRDPLDPKSYPYRSARAGDYVSGSSAGLTRLLVEDARRAVTHEQQTHLKDQVRTFLACRTILWKHAEEALAALPEIP